MEWIDLAQDGEHRRANVNTGMVRLLASQGRGSMELILTFLSAIRAHKTAELLSATVSHI
jgi:hypothetical protein